MSLTAYPTLRLKLTMPQALKLQFLPAIPGSNASAAADRAEQAAQDAQDAANTAVAATANKVDRTGDVMTGFLTLNADPTLALHAATKQYVDSHSAGIPDGDKGDITTSSGGTVWTIDADAVTYAKIQNVSVSARFLGRFSGGAGDIEEGTGTQATALLDVFTSTLKGLAPLSGGGTTNFLRADGTWAAPAGGGGGAPVGAEYITASADATLTNERVLTNTASITWDFTTPGQAKASTAAGGGNVSNSGTPTVGQYAKWVTATTIQGVAVGTVLTDIGAQPLDADLTAIAALAGTNVIYYRSAANTWTAVTIGANLTFTGGTLAATGGGGGVSISGTPVAGQVAEWTNATTIRGVNSVPHYTASATAPVAPIAGDQWYDLNSGMLSIYVNDGNSSQWVQIGGGSLGTPSLGVVLRVITTSQSYVPTPGTQFVVVECIGGGGGGGGAGATTSFTGGAGGGAGGRSLARLTAAQIGGSKPVTIGIGGAAGAAAFAPSGNGGNGGDTSLDALCVAKGGTGGQGAITANAGGNGGAGGIAGTGDVTGTGAPGGSAVGAAVQTTGAYTSLGGSSAWGGGAVAPNQTVGAAAGGYGGGGSGGTTFSAAVGGGNGSPGIVIITEYVVTLVTVVGSPTTVGGPPQGRLTLVTQTPVMTATAAGIGSIFYTPYVGDKIPLYDGVNWLMTPFTELTCLATDTTKNPAAIGASKVNDWFVWSDAGTLRLSHGPDWTSDTTRSAGTAHTKLNGILTNAVAITNGPGVNRGTYVGTTRSDTGAALSHYFGAAGQPAFLGIWNCYNRVKVAARVWDATGWWTKNDTTWTFMNGNNTNNKIQFVVGLVEDALEASLFAMVTVGPNADYMLGMGFDSSGVVFASSYMSDNNGTQTLHHVGLPPAIGFHSLDALEKQLTPTTAATVYGGGFGTQTQMLNFGMVM